MAFDWSKAFAWIKPRPTTVFALFLVSTFALFAPDGLLRSLGLLALVADWKPWIGVGFVAAAAYLTSLSLRWVFTGRNSPIREWWRVRLYQRVLHDLNGEEKGVLHQYIADDSVTHYFEIQDGVVSGLVQKHVLWRASQLSVRLTTFPYNIQPWARRYLRNHPELLK